MEMNIKGKYDKEKKEKKKEKYDQKEKNNLELFLINKYVFF
jgi:hypothetical protein